MKEASVYHLNGNRPDKGIYPSTLRLGGTDPAGNTISFTNYYMEWNGEPFFGICGEFHYSRYPHRAWRTELAKMKATGVNIVATYIFWNHHEELEGVYCWEGDRDLRRFVELCAEQGLHVILRIGPFCHGEVRNGGMPDWLFGRTFEVRSNDPAYLRYVDKLYREIGRQARGLMFKDGGPVIGIQLENEFRASAALWEVTAKQGDEYMNGGEGGAEHMRTLKELALAAGLEAPIYTSTGWGGAPILEDEVLPLYGGYAYTPWTVKRDQPLQQPTGEYVFVHFHHNTAPAGEFDPPYDRTRYPFACCEMGGGMQTWYLARFAVEPESAAAMALMKIAGGCNFVGYYMLHGGTNPLGRTGYLNESSTPRFTYDFQAPLGEFGQVRESAARLRLMHAWVRQFGGKLAQMDTALPDTAADITPDDSRTLRYAARVKGNSGFLFVNNYQDHVQMRRHEQVTFRVELGEETVTFPRHAPLAIADKLSAVFPLHLDLDGVMLQYATAQPITRIEDGSGVPHYFFFMPDGVDSELCLDADSGKLEVVEHRGAVCIRTAQEVCFVMRAGARADLRLRTAAGGELRLVVLPLQEALTLTELELKGRRRLVWCEHPVAVEGERLQLFTGGEEQVRLDIFPGEDLGALAGVGLAGLEKTLAEDGTLTCVLQTQPVSIALHLERCSDSKVALQIAEEAYSDVEDILLSIDYIGNVGYAFAGGELIHDNFHNGQPWELGLSRFRERIAGRELVLQVTPTHPEVVPADGVLSQERHAHIRDVSVRPVCRLVLA